MNIYDGAHDLAKQIRQTDEYRNYTAAKDAAYANETNRQLIKEYKKLQFQLQVAMAGGGQPNAEDMEKLQKLTGVLQFSKEASVYLMAEMQMQRMLADIYKIIGEAADMDMDFMNA